MTTMPPITPPAMGPAGDDDFPDWPLLLEAAAAPPIGVQSVTAQLSQPPPMREQISFGPQAGHGGGVAGQVAHLLNSSGRDKSASARSASSLHAFALTHQIGPTSPDPLDKSCLILTRASSSPPHACLIRYNSCSHLQSFVSELRPSLSLCHFLCYVLRSPCTFP